MTDKAGANWFDFGAQMAQAWQQVQEKWWQALLADPARLEELASRLGFAAGASPGAGDLERIVKALELMQARLSDLEKKVGELSLRAERADSR